MIHWNSFDIGRVPDLVKTCKQHQMLRLQSACLAQPACSAGIDVCVVHLTVWPFSHSTPCYGEVCVFSTWRVLNWGYCRFSKSWGLMQAEHEKQHIHCNGLMCNSSCPVGLAKFVFKSRSVPRLFILCKLPLTHVCPCLPQDNFHTIKGVTPTTWLKISKHRCVDKLQSETVLVSEGLCTSVQALVALVASLVVLASWSKCLNWSKVKQVF